MKKVIDILSDQYCEVIRPIIVNYNLIEVQRGHCWSVKERRFVTSSIKEEEMGLMTPRAFCDYDPDKQPDPKYFREILENSLDETDVGTFCEDFLKLFDHNKKQHKDKVPCLVGDTNSGKTSLFLPVLGIVHHTNVATVTKQRVFNKAMINKSTEVIFIDEATPNTLDIDDWKILTQGGYAAYDVKYQTAKSFINKCPMLVTSQSKLAFETEDQKAMDRRLRTPLKSTKTPDDETVQLSDDDTTSDNGDEEEQEPADQRISVLTKILRQCSPSSLKHRQINNLLQVQIHQKQEEQEKAERHYRMRQQLLLGKGVTREHIELLPRDDRIPIPLPIVQDMETFHQALLKKKSSKRERNYK
ncbi:hypothetical protein QZH41_013521, partial [Actinostola sp. cb2023]